MHDLVDNAECPGCGARSSLDPEHSYPDARSCGACRGWFLERDTAYRFLVEELGTATHDIARMLATPGERRRRCPACDKGMSAIVVLGDDVDLCPGCGGTWLPPGAMQKLSRGRYGKEAPPTGALTTPAHRSALPGPAAAGPQNGVATAAPSAPPSPFGLPTGERPASPFGPPRDAPPAATTAEMPRAVTFPSSEGAPLAQAAALELARPVRRSDDSINVEPAPAAEAAREAGRAAAGHAVVQVGKPAPAAAPSSNGSFEATALGTAGVPPVARSKLTYLLGGAALLLAAVVVVIVLVATGGSEEEPAPQAQVDETQKYAAYLRHYRFGGRNLDWWSARLTELSPGGAGADAKLFALTKDRAERLGLVINEHPGRVEVKLSQPLTARLLDRLEVK